MLLILVAWTSIGRLDTAVSNSLGGFIEVGSSPSPLSERMDWSYGECGIPKIVSGYLSRTDNNGRRRQWLHSGIDIVAPYGTPILAPADGKARQFYDRKYGGGLQVAIDHFVPYYYPGLDERGKMNSMHFITTIYAHLSDTERLKGKRKVKRGDVIGYVGRSGGTELVHLHFRVKSLGHNNGLYGPHWVKTSINPHLLWREPGGISCFHPENNYPSDTLVLTYPLPCSC